MAVFMGMTKFIPTAAASKNSRNQQETALPPTAGPPAVEPLGVGEGRARAC